MQQYKATIELSFNGKDEKLNKIILEHAEIRAFEDKLDDYARELADSQDASIRITNFYEVQQ